MNILDAVGISIPCRSCGNSYQVPLRDVFLSHAVLHEGCPVSPETECPPVFQSRLFGRKDIEEFQRAWNRLEQRARSDGGELVLMAEGPPAESQASISKEAPKRTVRQAKSSAPVTLFATKRSAKTLTERSHRTKQKKRKIAGE